MNEERWLESCDPNAMLELLRNSGKASERKLRLFAVACCRRIWHLIPVREAKACLDAAERYADGLAGAGELGAAVQSSMRACLDQSRLQREAGRPWGRVEAEAINAVGRVHRTEGGGRGCTLGATAAALAISEILKGRDDGDIGPGLAGRIGSLQRAEHGNQAAFLRDIFGTPFRPGSFIAEGVLGWSDGLIVKMAAAIYEDRSLPSGHLDPDRLAVLSDALEDAGCTDDRLLNHLRDDGPHVRGCWAIDAVLGKS